MRQSNSHEFHICRQVCDQAKQICKIIHSIHRIQASSCSHKYLYSECTMGYPQTTQGLSTLLPMIALTPINGPQPFIVQYVSALPTSTSIPRLHFHVLFSNMYRDVRLEYNSDLETRVDIIHGSRLLDSWIKMTSKLVMTIEIQPWRGNYEIQTFACETRLLAFHNHDDIEARDDDRNSTVAWKLRNTDIRMRDALVCLPPPPLQAPPSSRPSRPPRGLPPLLDIEGPLVGRFIRGDINFDKWGPARGPHKVEPSN